MSNFLMHARYGLLILLSVAGLSLFALPIQAEPSGLEPSNSEPRNSEPRNSEPWNSEPWNLDRLMQMLAKTRSAHASFVETKFINFLEKPVQSSGELFYKAPDFFEKRTLKPKPESMVLDGGTLVIERGRKKHTLQLQTYPEIAAFIDSIRGTLAGDRKALERTYHLSLQGNAQGWKLLLTPIDSKMKKVVVDINISGVNDELRTIEINQADGDSSLMTIKNLDVQ